MPRSSASYPSGAAGVEGRGRSRGGGRAAAGLSPALSPEGEAAGAGEAAEAAAAEAGALGEDGEGYTILGQPGWEVMGNYSVQMPTTLALIRLLRQFLHQAQDTDGEVAVSSSMHEAWDDIHSAEAARAYRAYGSLQVC